MFIGSKYTIWYNNIIRNAREREIPKGMYTERHHIIPVSLGGSNHPSNIVRLTAKEHFIAHHLLTKMVSSPVDKRKMWSAFFMMHCSPSREPRFYTHRTYCIARQKMAEGKKALRGENNKLTGRKLSKEHRESLSKGWNKESPRNADSTVYNFYHKDHGLVRSTRRDLCIKYNLNQKRIYTIANKRANIACGWSINWENDQIS